MKRILAPLLAVMLMVACAATAWAFTDTNNLGEAQLLALEKMNGMGVIEGYPDGSFLPDNHVTRAEFAKMLCVFAEQQQLNNADSAFVDVLPSAWYAGWVARASQKQWLNGYPGREYRPQAHISQQEIATVLVRIRGLQADGFVWPQDYITAAQDAGFLADIDFAGAEPASRIIACQMLYNALPPVEEPQQQQQPATTETLRGIITAIKGTEITVMDSSGKSSVYEAGALLPEKLFPGAYLEAQAADKYLIQVAQAYNLKKATAYWDLALDGSTAVMDGTKYNIEDAEIFVVTYALSKPFSADTYIGTAMIDRSILSLGGRLAAEAAVVLEADGGVLKRALVVNASVAISGGRLDVVEGPFNSTKGEGISFLGRSGGLPLASGVSMPNTGAFIHYNLKNGEISSCVELYSANANYLPEVSQILSGGNEDSPYAWVHPDGKASPAAIDLHESTLPRIISVGSGQKTVELGAGEGSGTAYWLAEGCLIYEVKGGKIESGSKSSLEKGQMVIALVSRYGDICYMFCMMD